MSYSTMVAMHKECVCVSLFHVIMLFKLHRDTAHPFRQELEQNSITARILSDALPFIQDHADETIVIKYGGHAMEDAEASLSFARDVVMLKQVCPRSSG